MGTTVVEENDEIKTKLCLCQIFFVLFKVDLQLTTERSLEPHHRDAKH